MINDRTQLLLEQKYRQYAQPEFVHSDPISVPHRFSQKEDIEIAGFLAATIAWGSRPMIVRSALEMVQRMDFAPYQFVQEAQSSDFKKLLGFKYRTFSTDDLLYFVHSLQQIYQHHGGLEAIFTRGYLENGSTWDAIAAVRDQFLQHEHLTRSEKHLANVHKKSAAKRLHMYLRWMVRPATEGIDFGLWQQIPTSALMVPLDIHSAGVARKLELLHRTQNDRAAVEELTESLRELDPNDPSKYDYAIFGLGMFEKYWM